MLTSQVPDVRLSGAEMPVLRAAHTEFVSDAGCVTGISGGEQARAFGIIGTISNAQQFLADL